MATTPDPILNEIMLRFSAFGLSGAHMKRMVIETDPFTGQTRERVGSPESIFGFPALQQVLGEALTQAVEGNNQLQADKTELQGEVDTLTNDLAAAQQQIADLEAQLAAATEPPASEPDPDAGDSEQPTDQPA